MLKLIIITLIFNFSSIFAQENNTLNIEYSKPNYANPYIEDDDDYDNVSNEYDKCPSTPNGVCVNEDGCTQKVKRVLNFDSSSYKVSAKMATQLQSIIEIAIECFGYKVAIIGHTDSTADEVYNKKLSKNRAMAIENIILSYDINPNRITTKWFGESKPAASNITKDGRYKNRRVEIIFY